MNRYDVASVAKFSPLSFNELAAAPTMMRQKHDASIAQAEALRIKANPLDKHLNRALEIKNQMDNEIANNVDTLNKEGYNPTTFQNIIKLNRQYQDMISPTGEIGQINNAKVVYDKAQEDFIQDAAKQNIGRDRAINLWKEKTAYYTGFGNDGKSITNVDPQGVAQFQDYTKDKQVAHSILGKTITGVSSQGHRLEPDRVNGGFWEVTRNGKRVKNNNTIQVENALKSMLDKWDSPNGEGKKWLMDSGDGLNRDRIINDFNSMLERSDINDVSESANYNALNIGDGNNPQGGGKIISGESKIEASSKYDNYSDPLNEIKTLSTTIANGKGTTADKIRRDELIELRRIADSKMNQIPRYKEINNKLNSELNQWKNLSTKFNLSDNDRKVIKDNPNLIPQLLFSKGIGSYKGDKNDPALKMILNNSKLSNFNSLIKERQNYKDIAWNNSSKVVNTYNYIPTTVTEANDFENFNFQAGSIIKNVKNIDNILDIVDISQDDNNYSKVTPNHTKALTVAMKNADPKSFSISNPTPSGAGGRPQVTITFTTKKGTSASDIDDSGKFSDDTLGGDEKTISFVANLKNSKDNPTSADMIGSFSKHLRDYYGGKGDVIPQGVGAGLKTGDHLKNTMIYNQYKGNTVQELSRAAYSTDGTTVQMKDEDAFNLLAGKAAKKGMRVDDYIRYYGKEKI
jgi:hypothetical protein